MIEAALPLLTTWQPFYGMIGSAAATLIGLLFVVVTLTTRVRGVDTNQAVAAFSTPNVTHFCAALLIAATFNAPWQVLWNPSIVLGPCGFAGVIYAIIVGRRMRHQTSYEPVLEDWLWHVVFPFISYTALVIAAILLSSNPVPTLFVTGAATVLLLFIGIHNAWDTVTYITVVRPLSENKPQNQ
jgi:hypothetical protein